MRLNIEDRFFSEPRYRILANRIGVEDETAIGMLCLLWHGTQAMEIVETTADDLVLFMNPSGRLKIDKDTLLQAMLEAKFCRATKSKKIELKGNLAQIEQQKVYKARAKKAANAKWNPDVNASSIEEAPNKQCLSNAITNTNTNTTKDLRDTNVSLVDRVDYEAFKNLWNDNCGSLSKVKTVSPKRKTHIKARVREVPDLDYWKEVIRRMSVSDFCTGQKPNSDWKADFDFLLKPDTHIKVEEGKYDNPKRMSVTEILKQQRKQDRAKEQQNA